MRFKPNQTETHTQPSTYTHKELPLQYMPLFWLSPPCPPGQSHGDKTEITTYVSCFFSLVLPDGDNPDVLDGTSALLAWKEQYQPYLPTY